MPSGTNIAIATGYLWAIIYMLFIVIGIVVAVVALWRLMKAQEEIARALHRIATTFDHRSS